MAKGGAKVCPRCGKRLNANAPHECPTPEPVDIFRSQLARASDHPEHYQKFIDGLARTERLRLAAGSASLRPPELQREIDALVLLASPLHPARPPAGVVRKQQLAAFVVLPELIRGLGAFQAAWALFLEPHSQRPRSFNSRFRAFQETQKNLNDVLQSPGFWETDRGEDVVTRRPLDAAARRIDSPYFESLPARRGAALAPWQPLLQPHRLAKNGDNTWLDRFLYARTALSLACGALRDLPLVQRALQNTSTPEDSDLSPEVLLALAAVKAEFYTLFALVAAAPVLPLPDFSAAGAALNGKFTAVHGSFVVWSSGNEHDRLADPQNLRLRLRFAAELRALGLALAALPGVWPPSAAAVAATLAALRARQLAALAQVAAGDELRSAPGWRDPRSAKSNHDAFHDSVRRLRLETQEASSKQRHTRLETQEASGTARPRIVVHPGPPIPTSDSLDLRESLNPYDDLYIAAALDVADDDRLAGLVALTPGEQQAWRLLTRSFLRRLNPDAVPATNAAILALGQEELRRLAGLSDGEAREFLRGRMYHTAANPWLQQTAPADDAEAGAPDPARRTPRLTLRARAARPHPDDADDAMVHAAILASMRWDAEAAMLLAATSAPPQPKNPPQPPQR